MTAPKILHIDKALVDKAVSLWRAGQLVAIPTETVYGLGADATNGEAVARIYQVKARPQFNPLIAHVADAESAMRYGQWNAVAEKLASVFWPGPMTLVLNHRLASPISALARAGGDTIALRVPGHPVAQQLLKAFGGPIVAPSANRSGRVSPTTAAHVKSELGAVIPLIIDGGPCELGLESTVIDLTGEAPVILRPGSITRAMIEAIGVRLGEAGGVSTQLKSPGMLESHYAPSIPVRLNATDVAADEALLAFGPSPLPGAAKTVNLSEHGILLEAAANLFACLRLLDTPDVKRIAVMPIPDTGVGEAMNDRLKRAAV